MSAVSQPDDAFAKLEAAILDCLSDRNWERLGTLLDPDFRITTAGWLDEPASREQWMDGLATTHEPLTSYELHSVDSRLLGDVSVVLVLSTQRLPWKGQPFEGKFRYTDVFRRSEDGTWLLHTRHASLRPPD
jgi:hypothetical protein